MARLYLTIKIKQNNIYVFFNANFCRKARLLTEKFLQNFRLSEKKIFYTAETRHCLVDMIRLEWHSMAHLLLMTTDIQVTLVVSMTRHCCGEMSRQLWHLMTHMLLSITTTLQLSPTKSFEGREVLNTLWQLEWQYITQGF